MKENKKTNKRKKQRRVQEYQDKTRQAKTSKISSEYSFSASNILIFGTTKVITIFHQEMNKRPLASVKNSERIRFGTDTKGSQASSFIIYCITNFNNSNYFCNL